MRLSTRNPPDDEAPSSGDLVTIAVAYSLPDAAVMQTTLRAHGIPCYTQGYQLASVEWYWLTALGGIAVSVPASLKDEAIALIPSLAEPRTRKDITAEIKANGGPYARWRLIIAHLLIAGPLALLNVSLILSSAYSISASEGFLWFLLLLIFTIINFFVLFAGPF